MNTRVLGLARPVAHDVYEAGKRWFESIRITKLISFTS